MTTEIINEALVKAQPINFRKNLTASSWSACDRAMWFTFRNVSAVQHKAETLRTFAMGHLLEDAIVNWLKIAGYKIAYQQQELFNKFGNPIGHIDGVIVDDGNIPRLLEIKTANSKRFKEWLKNGVPDSYKAQVQIYMHHSHQFSKSGKRLTSAKFVVLNKDTSEIHTEVMEFDEQYAELQVERLENIIEAESMPIGEDSFICNFCDHKAVCKGEILSTVDTCRTCSNVSVVNGNFQCQFGETRCENHVIHPQLVELTGRKLTSINHEHQALVFDTFAVAPTGTRIEGIATFDSNELKIAIEQYALDDGVLLEHKEMFSATVENIVPLPNKEHETTTYGF